VTVAEELSQALNQSLGSIIVPVWIGMDRVLGQPDRFTLQLIDSSSSVSDDRHDR
jgi:hypothetical protein